MNNKKKAHENDFMSFKNVMLKQKKLKSKNTIKEYQY